MDGWKNPRPGSEHLLQVQREGRGLESLDCVGLGGRRRRVKALGWGVGQRVGGKLERAESQKLKEQRLEHIKMNRALVHTCVWLDHSMSWAWGSVREEILLQPQRSLRRRCYNDVLSFDDRDTPCHTRMGSPEMQLENSQRLS